jgi:hypothetical protein
MERDELTELAYITAIANLASIAARGILSHRLAARIPHIDLAMAEIQSRRDGKPVPDVRRARPRDVHDYAPLYISPRNPMLYVRSGRHEEICVLSVDPAVLDLEHVVVADGNAASDYTRFSAAPGGLAEVDAEMTFAEWWTDPGNYYGYLERKRRKCAEVLVPDRVDPRYVTGVYVSCKEARRACRAIPVPWPITVDPNLFFQE